MKIIALGDTHGRNKWKEIVSKNMDADFFIFIGDYFDARDGGYSANRQIENFKDILNFKRENPNRTVLLIGNHDFHYIKGVNENYSSYQFGYAKDISKVIHEALDEGLLQMAFKHNSFLFTHAGLTKTWSKTWLGTDKPNLDTLVVSINDLFKNNLEAFKFHMGSNFSNTGNDVTQSPIWVRPSVLVDDMVEGIICVVGHTTMKQILFYDEYPNLTMIDTIGTSGEFLIIENDKQIVGTV